MGLFARRCNETRLVHPRAARFGCVIGLVLLVSATTFHPMARAQEPVEKQEVNLPQEHSWIFQGHPSQPAGLHLLGPEAKQRVQFDDAGLRITLPTGWKGERQGTGVEADLRVQGDFVVTMSFEILKEPARNETGKYATRLSLGISKDTVKNDLATHSWGVTGSRGSVFVSWASFWNNQTGKKSQPSNIFPTKARAGKLRLERLGDQLLYHAAEGADGDFRLLTAYPFGSEDVINVRITAATTSEKAELDVRVTELQVRATALANLPGPPTATGAAPSEEELGGITPRVMALGGVVALFVVLGVWLFVRQRRRAPKMANGSGRQAADAPLVSFACAACGKNLKAKAELAGKNVKCPQCAQAVLVPASRVPENSQK